MDTNIYLLIKLWSKAITPDFAATLRRQPQATLFGDRAAYN
ncbi:MAG: hypothetical protein ACFCU5_05425 [Pleurocapsa sp.]